MNKNVNFNQCKCFDDIVNVINDALKYDVVVDDEASVCDWFRDAEMEGKVISRDVIYTYVSIWNEERNGEELYYVRIREHFIDSGSEDYVYSYCIYCLK